MILQMHWQFRDGTTEMRSQIEITGDHNGNERQRLVEFVRDTQKKHPLPDKAIWMLCNELSRHFVVTTCAGR